MKGSFVTISTRSKNQSKNNEPLLFADDVWPGAQYMADFLDKHSVECKDKTILELGAGAALPSLIACKLGAKRCCITDYPAVNLIENIESLITANSIPASQAKALGYIWGHDVNELSSQTDCGRFDLILLAELLWKDTKPLHRALLSSVRQLLAATGKALVTLAHRPTPTQESCFLHVVHTAEDDLEFFKLAVSDFGFVVTRLGSCADYNDAASGSGEAVEVFLFQITHADTS